MQKRWQNSVADQAPVVVGEASPQPLPYLRTLPHHRGCATCWTPAHAATRRKKLDGQTLGS